MEYSFRNLLLNTVCIDNEGQWDKMYATIKARKTYDSDLMKENLEKIKSEFVTLGTTDYPVSLRYCDRPPFCFYYYGNIGLLGTNVRRLGVCGTRNPSDYTVNKMTAILDDVLNKDNDIVIVAGMAKGVDSIAHRVAMKHNLPTIVVLGCGIDRVYPTSSQDIYDYCKSGKGLIISEYPLNIEPKSEHFPIRNRIIAVLSKSLFVPQGKMHSGTQITMRYALDNNRDILCLPQRLEDSEATCRFVNDGAMMVFDSEDILDSLRCSAADHKVFAMKNEDDMNYEE